MTWPKRGFPILPCALRRAWKNEMLPLVVTTRAGLRADMRLGALDETAWKEVPQSAQLDTLEAYLVHLVTSRLYQRIETLGGSAVEGELDESIWEQLDLTRRTIRALERVSHLGDTAWLRTATATDILSVRGMGARSYLDLTCNVEGEMPTTPRQPSISTTAMAESLLSLPSESVSERVEQDCEEVVSALDVLADSFPLCDIYSDDPRLSHLDMDGGDASLYDTIRGCLESAQREGWTGSVTTLEEVRELLPRLEEALRGIEGESLTEELTALLNWATPEAHRAALRRRLGWDGAGGATLAEAGSVSRVSRERIRQVEKRVRDKLRGICFVPAVDRAIDAMNAAAMDFENDGSYCLRRANLVSSDFMPAGLVTAAEVFGREIEFEVHANGRGLLVPGTGSDAFASVIRGLGDQNFVISLQEVAARLERFEEPAVAENMARQWVPNLPNAVSLDAAGEWYWIRQRAGWNRYVNIIRSVLSVCDAVSLGSLRDALARATRRRGSAPSIPRSVLPAFCRAAGFTVSDDSEVSCSSPLALEKEVGDAERLLLEVLRDNGSVMIGTHLRREAAIRGQNINTTFQYLSYSPVIERIAPLVYAVRGSSVDPGLVETLRRQARSKRSSAPVFTDTGWTADGAVWLGYHISEATVASGVVSVPASIRTVIGIREFELFASDGAGLGLLNISESGSAWGLGPFFRRRGVEAGDYLVLTLSPDFECAVAIAGEAELMERYQEGLGWSSVQYLEEATRPDTEE